MRKIPLCENFCCYFGLRKGLLCYAIVNVIICMFITWCMRYVLYKEKYTDIIETTIFFTAPIDTVFTLILGIAVHQNLTCLLKFVAGYNMSWVLLHLGMIVYMIMVIAEFVSGGHNPAPIILLFILYFFVPILWIFYRAYIFVIIISLVKKLEHIEASKVNKKHVEVL